MAARRWAGRRIAGRATGDRLAGRRSPEAMAYMHYETVAHKKTAGLHRRFFIFNRS